MFNERAKTCEVALQGTIHAIVPVTGVSPRGTMPDIQNDEARKRLERALAEVGDKYGIRLRFVPDKPSDYTLRAEDIKQYVVWTGGGGHGGGGGGYSQADDTIALPRGVTISPVQFPHGTDPGAATDKESLTVEGLPKCTASEENRANTLEGLNRSEIRHGDADRWLHIAKGERSDRHTAYHAMCPFCGDAMEMGTVHVENKAESVVDDFKMCLPPTDCPTCQIKFTWDFTKNTVKMEKMGGGKERKPETSMLGKLEKAVESIDGVHLCTADQRTNELAVEVKITPDLMKTANGVDQRVRTIAKTIWGHLPSHIGTHGDHEYFLDSGREIRWTWV